MNRRQTIRENLRPLQINQGLVVIDEITLDLPSHTAEHLRSLSQFGKNLTPVILLRCGNDYNAVAGYQWVSAAQEAGLDSLWCWVFDDLDMAEQAALDLENL
jgi:hypothetical protein